MIFCKGTGQFATTYEHWASYEMVDGHKHFEQLCSACEQDTRHDSDHVDATGAVRDAVLEVIKGGGWDFYDNEIGDAQQADFANRVIAALGLID